MIEPLIDVSSGKAISSSSESNYDTIGFEAHLNLKSTKLSPEIIKLIPVIPIEVFSPLVQPSNQTCSTSKAEHVIHVQHEITLPS